MKSTNALIAKEIRLLLPAYGAALLLAVVPVWIMPHDFFHQNYYAATASSAALYTLTFGMAMLALSSFGREFAMKTFPTLIALPVERNRVWWTKVEILAPAIVSLFAAWAFSMAVRIGPIIVSPGGSLPTWARESLSARPVMLQLMWHGAVMTLTVFAGGLCATLLLRQIAAAFWFTFLVPPVLQTVLSAVGAPDWLHYLALGLYSVAAFLWAQRLFYQAQEVGWTGGTIVMPGWRSGDAARPAIRSRRPLAALFWKEVQLHQVGLVGIIGLFLLHLAAVALRKPGRGTGDMLRTGLDVFGGLWFLVPLLIGGTSVAEERKLGTMQAHLTLPVSRRIQFTIKLLMVLVVGGLLSALFLWTAEGIAAARGADCGVELLQTPFSIHALSMLCWLFLAWSLICFYASSLVNGLISSFATSVLVAGSLWLAAGSIPLLNSVLYQKFGMIPWVSLYLLNLIAIPGLVTTVVWLGYRNFKNVTESWQLWRRNLVAFIVVVLSIEMATLAIYNRVWEFLMPLEPAHGAARFALSPPPTLKSFNPATLGLDVLMPDGKIWADRVDYHEGKIWLGMPIGQKWITVSGNHLLSGSNWMDVAATSFETVAIRSNGTLWLSEQPIHAWRRENGKVIWNDVEPAPLVQFGNETNWQKVVPDEWASVVLLKQDGTLWHWSPTAEQAKEDENKHKPWPGLRAFQPHRLGTDTNWARIVETRGFISAWKADGKHWTIYYARKEPGTNEVALEPGMVMSRQTNFDNFKFRTIASGWIFSAALDDDGGVWAWYGPWQSPVRLGKDHDWTSLAGDGARFVARKADGSLWQWNFSGPLVSGQAWTPVQWFESSAAMPPTRLGTHNDWLAVVGSDWPRGVVSLAADGSLWQWWLRSPINYNYDLDGVDLSPSRKPSFIANILGNQSNP